MDLIDGFSRESLGFRFGPANRVGPGSGVVTANAACSRWLYRVSACAKDLLTKNTDLCFLFSSSMNRATLTETSKTAKYTKSVSSDSGLERTRGSARYSLIAVRALSHSSFHPAWLAPLRVTKNDFRRYVN